MTTNRNLTCCVCSDPAGRVFNVMAMFRNNPTGTAKAKAYLAHQDDTGRPA